MGGDLGWWLICSVITVVFAIIYIIRKRKEGNREEVVNGILMVIICVTPASMLVCMVALFIACMGFGIYGITKLTDLIMKKKVNH